MTAEIDDEDSESRVVVAARYTLFDIRQSKSPMFVVNLVSQVARLKVPVPYHYLGIFVPEKFHQRPIRLVDVCSISTGFD
eukprot:768797-Hanusia_phi.AAC.5